MNSTDPNDRLSVTLAAWRVTPRRNPNFRPAVLESIRQRARESWLGYLRSHLLGWSTAAFLTLVAAGWTGHTLAEARIESSREEMVISYLGNLDPRVLAKLRH